MMTKIFAIIGIFIAATVNANAAGEAMFNKGHPVWDTQGVNCSTGATPSQVTISTPGYITSGVRIINQSAYDVWFGQSLLVSTKTLVGDSAANRGERLAAGASAIWELGYDHTRQTRPKLFCKAADAAAALTAPISVAIFAYP